MNSQRADRGIDLPATISVVPIRFTPVPQKAFTLGQATVLPERRPVGQGPSLLGPALSGPIRQHGAPITSPGTPVNTHAQLPVVVLALG
jgi:hypothetical protein